MALDANDIYRRQVQLLVRVLPLVDTEKCFALKGGTAINLFTEHCLDFRLISTYYIFRWMIEIQH